MRLGALAPMLAIAVLIGGCNGTQSTVSPGSSVPASAASPAHPGTTSGSGASGSLPAPTLTDPVAIGAALWDPSQVGVGVSSLLAALGVAIDADDGSPLRPAAGSGLADLHLSESEVRGLIEMGTVDARAISEHLSPFTLGDLSSALATVVPGMTADQILAAYVDAYRAAPGDLVRESLAGHAFVAEGAFTRVHLWLLLVDGVLGRDAVATAHVQLASTTGYTGAPGPVAQIGLPPIPSSIPGLDARDFVLVLAHLSLIGFQAPASLSIMPASAHEGHGGPGPTVAIEARYPIAAVPLLSVVDGRPLLVPIHGGLDGVPITFESTDEGTLWAHGFVQGAFGVPVLTDVLGTSRLGYQLRSEPANGVGTVQSAVATIYAVVDLRAIVMYRYIVAPEILPFIWGTRRVPALVTLEWHEEEPTPGPTGVGAYSVTLTGPKTGAGTYVGTGYVLCAAPTIDGRLYWSAQVVIFNALPGSLTDIGLQQNPAGFDTVSATAGGIETGSWFARSDIANSSATVTGSGGPGSNGHLTGHGSWTDSDSHTFTIDATLECSDTSY